MAWARGDDRYDDTRKIKKAWRMSGYAVGLHWMAITHCARHETDGLVDPEWLAERLAVIPKAAGDKAIKTLVDLALFDELPAGETRELTDEKGYMVTVGPLDEDAYIVHDFLDYNFSTAQNEAKRAEDAERKRKGRAKDSGASPDRVRADSEGTPAPVRAPAPPARPFPAQPNPESPLPPASGGDAVFPSSPAPPSGKRRRDQDRLQTARATHKAAVSAFVAEHFPDEHPSAVVNTAATLAFRRIEPTADRIRESLAEARTALEGEAA